MAERTGNSGASALAETLLKRMQQEATPETTIDFGVITDKMGLLTDAFPVEIPKGDYMICRQLTLGKTNDVFTQTQEIGNDNDGRHPHGPSGEHSQYAGSGIHSHPDSEGAHIHDVLVPETMRSLLPGDRVLVVWAGDDPVVIDIIEES